MALPPVTCESLTCPDNASCEASRGTITCRVLLPAGAPCDNGVMPCQPGLFCAIDFWVSEMGVCTPWLGIGDSCVGDEGHGCPQWESCSNNARCADRTLPGRPCPDGFCSGHDYTFCDSATKTCMPVKMPGEPCTPHWDQHPCYHSECDEDSHICTERCR